MINNPYHLNNPPIIKLAKIVYPQKDNIVATAPMIAEVRSAINQWLYQG